MLILHTSDWHLGRSLHGESLIEAHAAFLDHLVSTIDEESVDLLVVSGDIYDRALPPVEAVQLFDDSLARLASTKARVVITSGNHDSAVRLGTGARLADSAGVHVRTRWQDVGTPVLVDDTHGQVAIYGLPYLIPDQVARPWQLSERSHEAALLEATRRIDRDLAGRSARSVVMAHAFVAGDPAAALAMSSDSERDIAVGGLQIAPTAIFAHYDYTALGHLHGARALSDSVRYSGSPLAYSFSEAAHVKGSWLVELGAKGVAGSEFVDAPQARPMHRVRGELPLLLTEPSFAGLEESWLAVTLTDQAMPLDAMRRLRTRFPFALKIDFEPAGARPEQVRIARDVRGLSDLEIALGFVEEVRSTAATTEEQLLLQLACDSCHHNVDAEADAQVKVG